MFVSPTTIVPMACALGVAALVLLAVSVLAPPYAASGPAALRQGGDALLVCVSLGLGIQVCVWIVVVDCAGCQRAHLDFS